MQLKVKSILSVFLLMISCILSLNCRIGKKARLKFIMPGVQSFVGATITETENSTDLFEGTTTDTYSIVLKAAPEKNTEITVRFDGSQLKLNEKTTSPIQITFTPENWNVPQNISVMALYDGVAEGKTKSVITHTILSGNPFIADLEIGTVIANITDNEGSRLTSSFQSGTEVFSGTGSITAVLTSAVNSASSYVYCNFRMGSSAMDRVPTCQLSADGTSVNIQAGSSISGTSVNWYVVEFSKGVSVQRGSGTLAASQSSDLITLPVNTDLSRTFIIGYSRAASTLSNADERRTLRYRMTSQNTLEVIRNETGTAVSYEWQVIQMDGARVQSGISSIPDGSSSVSSSLSSLNINNSFIIMNAAAGSGVNGAETDYSVQGLLSSASELSLTRTGNSDSVDASWFAVEMIDGTSVQNGSLTVSASSQTANAALNAVDTSKTMIIYSCQTATGDSPSTTQDSGTFSSIFLNSSTIQFERANAESNIAKISWTAIQFH